MNIKNFFKKILNKHVIIDSTCPNCGRIGTKTTLSNNSYACKKCKTYWVN